MCVVGVVDVCGWSCSCVCVFGVVAVFVVGVVAVCVWLEL